MSIPLPELPASTEAEVRLTDKAAVVEVIVPVNQRTLAQLMAALNAALADLDLSDIPGLTDALADLSEGISAIDSAKLAKAANLSDLTDAAAARGNLDLVPGTDVQAFSERLAALAGLGGAANRMPYFTGATAMALAALTSFARTLLAAADAAEAREVLGVPAINHDHTAGQISDASANGRTLITAADFAAMRALLAFGITDIDGLQAALSAKAPTTAIRTKLTADTTFYVDPGGSDTNDGLTLGAAFVTEQGAFNAICDRYDFNGKIVDLQLSDGTWTGGLNVNRIWAGGGIFRLSGNAATPTSVVISTTSKNAVQVSAYGARVFLRNLKLQTTTSGHCIANVGGSDLALAGGVTFGACVGDHILVDHPGARVYGSTPYTIAGGATRHWDANSGRIDFTGVAITLTGSPAFVQAFAHAISCAAIECIGASFTGDATGKRYNVQGNGVVETSGLTFPGDVAGTATDGGRFT